MEWINGIIGSAIGLVALLLGKHGLDVARLVFGSGKLGEFASRTVVTALRRGVEVLKEEVDRDGWQPEDGIIALRESARVILGAATSQTAVDMYLNELPDWLKQTAFGSKDNAAIKRNSRNLEVIESQLTSAAEKLIDGSHKQIAMADAWFQASSR